MRALGQDDTAIPVVSATFESSGDPNYFWTETCTSSTGDILEMTWSGIGEPLIIHQLPTADGYGVVSTLIPAGESRRQRSAAAAGAKAELEPEPKPEREPEPAIEARAKAGAGDRAEMNRRASICTFSCLKE